MQNRNNHTGAVVIPAAGSGTRMGGNQPKQFLPVSGTPILALTIGRFLAVPEITGIVVPVAPDHHGTVTRLLTAFFSGADQQRITVVTGGATRQESVLAGLEAIPVDIPVILVHDGARPFVSATIIRQCLCECVAHGAAIAAVRVSDTIKEAAGKEVRRTIDRRNLWRAQTPQGAKGELLRHAYGLAERDGFTGTDEASLLEHAGIPVRIVEGSEQNFKITRPDDLVLAAALSTGVAQMRVGHGFDAHKFKSGRKLILGGVTIPHDLGLEGHSDADTLTHALIDALLGAMGAGDIGRHFPDHDEQFRNIRSLTLLEKVMALATEKNMVMVNADITIICQYPKLAPHIDEMRANLARACRIEPGAVNIKATTTEMMGFTGRGEGIAAHAVVLMGPAGPKNTGTA